MRETSLDLQLKFFKPPLDVTLLQTHVVVMFQFLQHIGSLGHPFLDEARLLLLTRDGELFVLDIKPCKLLRKCEAATIVNLKALLNDKHQTVGPNFLVTVKTLLDARKKRLEEILEVRGKVTEIIEQIDLAS